MQKSSSQYQYSSINIPVGRYRIIHLSLSIYIGLAKVWSVQVLQINMAWLSSSSRLAPLCLLLLVAASLAVATPEDYLNPHNVARGNVEVPAVVWNDTVAAFAEEYAADLYAGGCHLQPSSTEDYGENLYFNSDQSSTAADAVASWVSPTLDGDWYHHDTNTCTAPAGESCGHYTQVVWYNSTDIGCATVVCETGDNTGVVVACNYWPPGNIPGESPY
ncbi:pathogenesis-related protein PRMS [Oryza sativa Japonica Group]|nr:pathogenesis-related protein PRMS [Oryza sativa Japonica Group]